MTALQVPQCGQRTLDSVIETTPTRWENVQRSRRTGPFVSILIDVCGSGRRHLNGDLELHLGVQAGGHRVGPNRLDRFIDVNRVTIEFDTGLCGNCLDHIGYRNGTEEIAFGLGSGLHGDHRGHELGGDVGCC